MLLAEKRKEGRGGFSFGGSSSKQAVTGPSPSDS
jgi:hypothetical protein